MSAFKLRLLAMALPLLGACAGTPPGDMPVKPTASSVAPAAAADVYAGKSVLDAAIQAAGGEAALKNAHELDWSGTASVTAAGKTTEVELQTIVRPFTYGRSTTWPTGKPREAKTIQMDFGKAWSVSRVTWTPMPEAQEASEVQQFSLYGVMVLQTLKGPGVKVSETAPGADGTRNLHVEHPKAPAMDLRFDKSAKLIRAAYSVRDPAGGPTPIPQVAEFSGEIVSNGVKWPKTISIKQNGAPYFDLQIAKFESRTSDSVIPIQHTLGNEPAPNAPAAAVAPAGPLPAAVAAAQGPGGEIFNMRCNGCHGSGRGGAPAVSELQAKAAAEVVEALTTGKMQRQGSALSEDERKTVAMFVTKKPL
jgi:mono/diheme cytochrome c family protein